MPASPLIPSVFLPPLPKTRHTLAPLPASLLRAHLATLERMLAPPVVGSPPGVSPASEAMGGGQLDEFERGWCRTWLEGIIKRGEGWVGEVEGEEDGEEERARSEVVEGASTVIALMAGCSASGSLTRTFTFTTPVDPFVLFTPALASAAPSTVSSTPLPILTPVPSRPPSRSAIPTRFNLPITPDSTRCSSPVSNTPLRPSTPVTSATESADNPDSCAALPAPAIALDTLDIRLHDGAMPDHLAVGVLTWASSIFMAQAIASDPVGFFRLDEEGEAARVGQDGPRVLELGAGTGLLSIVSRKMLDRIGRAGTAAQAKRERRRSTGSDERTGEGEAAQSSRLGRRYGTVVATDFLPSVLNNLQKCVDLNVDDEADDESSREYSPADPPVQVLKLDWTTYPRMMAGLSDASGLLDASSPADPLAARINIARGRIGFTASPDNALDPALIPPFDVILVADCVYDTTHAQLIKDSLEWALRAPVSDEDGRVTQEGGVVHLLSPHRPTYTAESASIAAAFPFEAELAPHSDRQRQALAVEAAASAGSLPLSPARRLGWEIATKHQRELERIKGMGRADEVEYTWWQIGWA